MKERITIRGTNNNCLIHAFVVYMIAQIRAVSTEDLGGGLTVFNDVNPQKNETASSFLASLNTALTDLLGEDIDSNRTLNLIQSCDLSDAQLIFGLAMRQHLDNKLLQQPLSVTIPYVDDPIPIEIEPYGHELPAEVIPFIAAYLNIEPISIVYETNAEHANSGLYALENERAILHPLEDDILESAKEQCSFCIFHNVAAGHFDIDLDTEVLGDFIQLPIDYDVFASHQAAAKIISTTKAHTKERNHQITELINSVLLEKISGGDAPAPR